MSARSGQPDLRAPLHVLERVREAQLERARSALAAARAQAATLASARQAAQLEHEQAVAWTAERLRHGYDARAHLQAVHALARGEQQLATQALAAQRLEQGVALAAADCLARDRALACARKLREAAQARGAAIALQRASREADLAHLVRQAARAAASDGPGDGR